MIFVAPSGEQEAISGAGVGGALGPLVRSPAICTVEMRSDGQWASGSLTCAGFRGQVRIIKRKRRRKTQATATATATAMDGWPAAIGNAIKRLQPTNGGRSRPPPNP